MRTEKFENHRIHVDEAAARAGLGATASTSHSRRKTRGQESTADARSSLPPRLIASLPESAAVAPSGRVKHRRKRFRISRKETAARVAPRSGLKFTIVRRRTEFWDNRFVANFLLVFA